MMVISKETCEKEKVRRYGAMEPNTREIGKKIVLGDMENLFIKMEIDMKVNGCIMRPMVQESTSVRMVANTKELGEEICNMERGNKLGKMEAILKVNLLKESNKATESITGKMETFMKDSGRTINFTEKDCKN